MLSPFHTPFIFFFASRTSKGRSCRSNFFLRFILLTPAQFQSCILFVIFSSFFPHRRPWSASIRVVSTEEWLFFSCSCCVMRTEARANQTISFRFFFSTRKWRAYEFAESEVCTIYNVYDCHRIISVLSFSLCHRLLGLFGPSCSFSSITNKNRKEIGRCCCGNWCYD